MYIQIMLSGSRIDGQGRLSRPTSFIPSTSQICVINYHKQPYQNLLCSCRHSIVSGVAGSDEPQKSLDIY